MNLDIGKAFTYVTEDPKWIAALGLGGGAFLKFQEEGGELPKSGGSGGQTGSQPPTPF